MWASGHSADRDRHRPIPGQFRHVRSRLQRLFESAVVPVDPEMSFMMIPDSSLFVAQFFFCSQGLISASKTLARYITGTDSLWMAGSRKRSPQEGGTLFTVIGAWLVE